MLWNNLPERQKLKSKLPWYLFSDFRAKIWKFEESKQHLPFLFCFFETTRINEWIPSNKYQFGHWPSCLRLLQPMQSILLSSFNWVCYKKKGFHFYNFCVALFLVGGSFWHKFVSHFLKHKKKEIFQNQLANWRMRELIDLNNWWSFSLFFADM